MIQAATNRNSAGQLTQISINHESEAVAPSCDQLIAAIITPASTKSYATMRMTLTTRRVPSPTLKDISTPYS
jgi:hypothetical protein